MTLTLVIQTDLRLCGVIRPVMIVLYVIKRAHTMSTEALDDPYNQNTPFPLVRKGIKIPEQMVKLTEICWLCHGQSKLTHQQRFCIE